MPYATASVTVKRPTLSQLGMKMQRLTASHKDLLRERSRAVLADLEVVLAGGIPKADVREFLFVAAAHAA